MRMSKVIGGVTFSVQYEKKDELQFTMAKVALAPIMNGITLGVTTSMGVIAGGWPIGATHSKWSMHMCC